MAKKRKNSGCSDRLNTLKQPYFVNDFLKIIQNCQVVYLNYKEKQIFGTAKNKAKHQKIKNNQSNSYIYVVEQPQEIPLEEKKVSNVDFEEIPWIG